MNKFIRLIKVIIILLIFFTSYHCFSDDLEKKDIYEMIKSKIDYKITKNTKYDIKNGNLKMIYMLLCYMN